MYYTYFGENQEKPWEGESQFTPEIMYQNMTLPKCSRMITEKSNIQIDVNIKQVANANNKP